MKVLDYVTKNNIENFQCITVNQILLKHTHKSRKNNLSIIEEPFLRFNSCTLTNWKQYRSFHVFANKEIVKIIGNMFYVYFSEDDWKKEIEHIFVEDKRDFNYTFKII